MNPSDQYEYEEDDYLNEDDAQQIIETNEDLDVPMDEDDDDDNGDGNEDGQAVLDDETIGGMINDLDDSSVTFEGHQELVYSVALDPVVLDGSIAVTGGADDRARIWRTDLPEATEIAILSGHEDTVTDIKFSKKGQLLVTAGMDGKILVWAPQGPVATPGTVSVEDRAKAWSAPRLVATLDGPEEILSIDWHQNLIAAGSSDGTVWVWALPKGAVQHVFTYHASPVTSVKFTPDGRLLSGDEESSFSIWDLSTGVQTLKFSRDDARFAMEGGVTSIDVSPDGNLAIVGGHDGQLKCINLVNGQLMAAPDLKHDLNANLKDVDEYGSAIEAIEFSELIAGHPIFITADTQGRIYEWEANTLRKRLVVNHDDAVSSVTFIPGTTNFISTSVDRTLRIWDARSGQSVRTLLGHTEVVHKVAISADGKRAVSVGDDGVAKVFNL